jgi:hypothetical protein
VARQLCYDIVSNAVGEILLLRIAAQVGERQHRDRRLVRQRQRFARTMHKGPFVGLVFGRPVGSPHEHIHRLRDVLQIERPPRLECQIEPASDMLVHRAGDRHGAGRALGLQPCRHVHTVTVHVAAIHDHVANVNADAKPDASVGRLFAIMVGHLLLYLHCTAHRPIDTVEHDEKCVARGVDDPPAMRGDRRVDQVAAQCTQSLKRAGIIQPYEAAVAHDVRVHHRNQFPSVWRSCS